MTNNNPIINDYLNTQAVNPSSIPQSQVQSDLELLKKQESKYVGDNTKPSGLVIKQTLKINPNDSQELIGLRLRNPFRGE